MASMELQEIIQRVERPSAEEQLLLIALLSEKAGQGNQAPAPRYAWSDIQGIAPDLLPDEDAQAWVTRTRREAGTHRERLLNNPP